MVENQLVSNVMKRHQDAARKVFPGGVCAGGRNNLALEGPLIVESADGPWVTSIDQKQYLDFHLSAGAALFGFNHPNLRKAVAESLSHGFFLNFETPWHTQLGEKICTAVPCAEQVRFSNTGTEATMAAIRLARYTTGKNMILKFNGHFHGMHELVWFNHSSAQKPNKKHQIPTKADSAGIPSLFHQLVINTEFNDSRSFLDLIEKYRHDLAAVILEPISYNCGCMPAKVEFLQLVRNTCTSENIVLIFDEVLSGFRMGLGGAQEFFGITPDLCTLAKALGGGFPISALAGKKNIMTHLNPLGPVVMSGTYTGSLMSVIAGCKCMEMMEKPDFFLKLNNIATYFYEGIAYLFEHHKIEGHIRGIGSRFGLFFGVKDPENDYSFSTIASHFNSRMHKRFIALALQEGLYFRDTGFSLAPTHFGISSVHTKVNIDFALEAFDRVFACLKE